MKNNESDLLELWAKELVDNLYENTSLLSRDDEEYATKEITNTLKKLQQNDKSNSGCKITSFHEGVINQALGDKGLKRILQFRSNIKQDVFNALIGFLIHHNSFPNTPSIFFNEDGSLELLWNGDDDIPINVIFCPRTLKD